MRYLWDYAGLPRDLIRAMKYRPSILLARHCGRVLANSVPAVFEQNSWDLIVPVAPSLSSSRRRMFNPCAVMADEVVKALGTSVLERDILRHARSRPPQASLRHDDRLSGLRTLFECRSREQLCGKRILLVEDVITTGATTSAAAFILKSSGAASVDVLALARAQVWSRFRSRLHQIFPDFSTPSAPI